MCKHESPAYQAVSPHEATQQVMDVSLSALRKSFGALAQAIEANTFKNYSLA